MAKTPPALTNMVPKTFPRALPDTYFLVPAFNFWLKREYESKHKKEHIIRVTTNIKNCVNNGSDTTINCGKSAEVNIIAFGFVSEINNPCEYRLQALNLASHLLLIVFNCTPLRQIFIPIYNRYNAPNIFMTVKAVDEIITNALKPKIEHADIIKRPVTFPAAAINERNVPN